MPSFFTPETNSYDLYEIKSSTNLDKDHYFDATFQVAIFRQEKTIDRIFILHPDKNYIQTGNINIQTFFTLDELTEKVNDLTMEVINLRQDALRAFQAIETDSIVQVQSTFSDTLRSSKTG